MFEGDILCRSKFGQGSNFVFIVALSSDTEAMSGSTHSQMQRMINPISFKYQKLKINEDLKSNNNKSKNKESDSPN